MYRVFECIDELVALVETARGLPMSSSCVVPRSLALDLLDDLREAMPQDLPEAQAVLANREQTLGDAQARADALVGDAEAERDRVLSGSQAEAHKLVSDARAEHDRLIAAGRAEHERLITAAKDEHERLITQTTVYISAAHSAEQIHGDAADRSERMRDETDSYVDERLAAFADLLTKTLRSVENGRAALRDTAAPPPAPPTAEPAGPAGPAAGPEQISEPEDSWVDYGATLGSGESTQPSGSGNLTSRPHHR